MDAAEFTFFYSLLRGQSADGNVDRISLNIPETALFEHGLLKTTLFTSKDGQIMRRSSKRGNIPSIRNRFMSLSSGKSKSSSRKITSVTPVCVERRVTPRVLDAAHFTSLCEKLQTRAETLDDYGPKNSRFRHLPFCLQQYIQPYRDQRYVIGLQRSSDNNDFMSEVNVDRYSRAYAGEMNKSTMEFLRACDQMEGPDVHVSAEVEKATTSLVNYIEKVHGYVLDAIVCEFIQDNTGKLVMTSVLKTIWADDQALNLHPSRAVSQMSRAPSFTERDTPVIFDVDDVWVDDDGEEEDTTSSGVSSGRSSSRSSTTPSDYHSMAAAYKQLPTVKESVRSGRVSVPLTSELDNIALTNPNTAGVPKKPRNFSAPLRRHASMENLRDGMARRPPSRVQSKGSLIGGLGSEGNVYNRSKTSSSAGTSRASSRASSRANSRSSSRRSSISGDAEAAMLAAAVAGEDHHGCGCVSRQGGGLPTVHRACRPPVIVELSKGLVECQKEMSELKKRAQSAEDERAARAAEYERMKFERDQMEAQMKSVVELFHSQISDCKNQTQQLMRKSQDLEKQDMVSQKQVEGLQRELQLRSQKAEEERERLEHQLLSARNQLKKTAEALMEEQLNSNSKMKGELERVHTETKERIKSLEEEKESFAYQVIQPLASELQVAQEQIQHLGFKKYGGGWYAKDKLIESGARAKAKTNWKKALGAVRREYLSPASPVRSAPRV